MPALKIPADRHAEFMADWRGGLSGKALAAKYECSEPCVSQTARRLGLDARGFCGPRGQRATTLRHDSPAVLTGGEWRPGRHGVQRWCAA